MCSQGKSGTDSIFFRMISAIKSNIRKTMPTKIPANADLLSAPMVDAAVMREQGEQTHNDEDAGQGNPTCRQEVVRSASGILS